MCPQTICWIDHMDKLYPPVRHKNGWRRKKDIKSALLGTGDRNSPARLGYGRSLSLSLSLSLPLYISSFPYPNILFFLTEKGSRRFLGMA